jgi:predicted transcriptional regulator
MTVVMLLFHSHAVHAQYLNPVDSLFSIRPAYLLPESPAKMHFRHFEVNINGDKNPIPYIYTPTPDLNNPFLLDTRQSSYYTPRLVRDELNLMMHRPRDNAFVPVLGVAFIAAQMVNKYLLIADQLGVKPENILASIEQLPVLEALWQNSPQTCSEIYEQEQFKNNYTYTELLQAIHMLVEQNLVKVRKLEDQEKEYYPAIDKVQMQTIMEAGYQDSLYTPERKVQIDSLILHYKSQPY